MVNLRCLEGVSALFVDDGLYLAFLVEQFIGFDTSLFQLILEFLKVGDESTAMDKRVTDALGN